ncbi:MAG: sugar transferase [Paracoccus sp. (in: a-proteobacteria)]|nr:sugar transferase [Paracoccus sp. (in: a-proteobacteria)]
MFSRLTAQGGALRDDDAQFGANVSRIYTNGGKRLFDTILIILALPFLIPVMLVVALVVMLDGHSPIYTQDRLGRGWKRFRLLKFRTMKPDADKLLDTYLASDPQARIEWDRDQKLRNDPRVTPVGKFLRKSSLDELPQLINVLMGEMSLVGPRPMLPEQRVLYPGSYYAIHRPGLTGLWQISVRNGSAFAERAIYDERYSREVGFILDVKTIFQTFKVVARGTGC